MNRARPELVIITVVVPFRDALRYLPRTVPSLIGAATAMGGVDLIYVNHDSTDGSREYLMSLGQGVRVIDSKGGSIAAARNFGASQTDAEFLSFIDADCVIPSTYFEEALTALQVSGAVATGCEVDLPPQPGWVEKTWHGLHYVGRNRDVNYLNSANFFITREAFESVGEFREDLITGEDAELGERLRGAGHRIYEATAVQAIHLGNPKSVGQFYRRTVWHGLGMLGTLSQGGIDKPTAMMIIHFLLSISGLFVLIDSRMDLAERFGIALLLTFAVPGLTVVYRTWQTRRVPNVFGSIALYSLYYWGRLHALALVLTRQAATYTK